MFSCFCGTPAPSAPPQGNPATWSAADVQQWLKAEGLAKHAQGFNGMSGKELMALNPKGVVQRAGVNQHVQAAIVALQKTHNKPAAPVVQQRPASPSKIKLAINDEDDIQNDTGSKRDATGDQTPRKAKQLLGAAGADRDTAPALDSPARKSGPVAQAPKAAPKRIDTTVLTSLDYAKSLQRFCPGVDGPEPLARYLSALGAKAGAGLHEAVGRNALLGQVFAAAFTLHSAAGAARVNHENVAKLAALGGEAVVALDAAAKRGPVPVEQLEVVLAQLGSAIKYASVYTRPGWLLHMVCYEKMKEDFDAAHNAVAETLKSSGLDGGRGLPRADFRDVVKPLRRMIKAAGAGNLTEGLAYYGLSSLAQPVKDLAAHVGVGVTDMAAELEAVPRGADMELDVYYHNILMSGTDQAAKDKAYQDVFSWYDKDGDGFIDAAELKSVLADLGLLDAPAQAKGRSAGGASPGPSLAPPSPAHASAGGAPPSATALPGADADALVAAHIRLADKDGDGRLDFKEFCRFYDTVATSKARQLLRTTIGVQGEEDLKQVFMAFCNFGTRAGTAHMDGAHFVKLLNDCGQMGGPVNTTEADLIFTKAKTKGDRRINFEQFLSAIAMAASKKSMSLEEMARGILAKGAPIARATRTEDVRLHDDKSTYTGVYAKGGPRANEPTTSAVDLATLLSRAEKKPDAKATPGARPPLPGALGRGSSWATSSIVLQEHVPSAPAPPSATPSAKASPAPSRTTSLGGAASAGPASRQPSFGGADVPASATMRSSQGQGAGASNNSQRSGTWGRRSTNGGAAPSTENGNDDLYCMWQLFATYGAGANTSSANKQVEMDGARFVKLCRDCDLVDKHSFTVTSADIMFTKLKPKGYNKISFADFERALQQIAEAKGSTLEAVVAAIAHSAGPRDNRTPAKAPPSPMFKEAKA